MRDKLGGILINGLLGNPILARLHLFFELIIEDITPTPTPTPSTTPSVSATLPPPTLTKPNVTSVNGDLTLTPPLATPTPTPATPTPTPTATTFIPPDDGGGGGGGRSHAFDATPPKRVIRVTIRMKGREYTKIYTITQRMLRATINTINRLNRVVDTIRGVKVRVQQKTPPKVQVKVKRNDD
jgi:hypothetical protein